jgi:hypothetical protein
MPAGNGTDIPAVPPFEIKYKAMKKTSNTKISKTPAPAKTAAKPVKKAAAPAVKKSAPKAVVTSITAQVDVGFGNMLYIRGVGPGLNWEKGAVMTCKADDKWLITLADASGPVLCKFLINDLIWCAGDDFVVTPGTSAVLTPIF